jgi:hypothetical protein
MKKTLILLTLLSMVVLFTACDPTGNDPLHAELRLVPLTTGDLAKAVTGNDGHLYLPAADMPSLLARAAAADIDFGSVKATKTLQYVLMNVGNTDVYDITFDADNIAIYPEHVAMVPTPDEGGDLIALPIVSFTKEHVIPIDGVGSLMDMSVGAFNDMLSLSYNYDIEDTAGVENFDITDEYTVAGTLLGALIEIRASGQRIENTIQGPLERYGLAGFIDPFLNLLVYSDIIDTLVVYNNGNAPLPMRIVNSYLYTLYGGEPILDTLIQGGESIDISGMVRGDQFLNGADDTEHGNILFFGADRDQPYIFELLGTLCIDGEDGILINETANTY